MKVERALKLMRRFGEVGQDHMERYVLRYRNDLLVVNHRDGAVSGVSVRHDGVFDEPENDLFFGLSFGTVCAALRELTRDQETFTMAGHQAMGLSLTVWHCDDGSRGLWGLVAKALTAHPHPGRPAARSLEQELYLKAVAGDRYRGWAYAPGSRQKAVKLSGKAPRERLAALAAGAVRGEMPPEAFLDAAQDLLPDLSAMLALAVASVPRFCRGCAGRRYLPAPREAEYTHSRCAACGGSGVEELSP